MKAIVLKSRHLTGIEYLDLPKPEPRENEIRVRVVASSVTRGDVNLRTIPRPILIPLGWLFGFKPMITPGVEYAGVVEALGANVSTFQIGEAVFGTTTGLAYGGNAEYLCVPAQPKRAVILRKPASLSFNEAAVLPVGAMTALQNLSRLKLSQGDRILIYGASGSVGSYAVQMARHFGATVTAVCSGANREMVHALGAQRVLDYRQPETLLDATGYDAVFDAVGKLGRRRAGRLLSRSGRFTSVTTPTKETLADITLISDLAERGLVKPYIDRTYNLPEVQEAHRYVETGRKRGNVLITIGNP